MTTQPTLFAQPTLDAMLAECADDLAHEGYCCPATGRRCAVFFVGKWVDVPQYHRGYEFQLTTVSGRDYYRVRVMKEGA